MTIKVCHQKFNNTLDNIAKGVWITIQVLVWALIPLGIATIAGIHSVADCSGMSEGWDEICEDQNNAAGIMAIAFGIIFGIFTAILVPFMCNDDNIFQKLNKKFNLFRWNEDC